MNVAQHRALMRLCRGYHVLFVASNYHPQFDLPSGYVAGWIGDRIYVGCDPQGRISS
jgi:hypothetical protein